jgi:hypothetical protein
VSSTTATSTTKLAPGEVKKRPLTVAEAADQWEKAKRAADAAKPRLEEAAAVLIPYLRKTKTGIYKDRIQLMRGGGGLVLDQPKVREYLGKKLRGFQKRSKQSEYLALVDKDD